MCHEWGGREGGSFNSLAGYSRPGSSCRLAASFRAFPRFVQLIPSSLYTRLELATFCGKLIKSPKFGAVKTLNGG